jgi:hypothetical protein
VEERERTPRWLIAMKAVKWIIGGVRSLGPYLAIELILPGGSIVALLLWTYRHRTEAQATARPSLRQKHRLFRCYQRIQNHQGG